MTNNPETNSSAIALGAPGDDISKRELGVIVQRFKHVQKKKLERIQEFLHPSQRVFLQLLPLLFHTNHPAIPGYVTSTTPFGVFDYSPDITTLNVMTRLSKSFVLKKRAVLSYPVEALYLMGSVGSIAYSQKSDLDIWLCHSNDLGEDDLKALQNKAELIEKWADSINLEAHFFLVNTETFRLGEGSPLSDESCGDTQHHLLLEEFYRSGLYIAGKTPIWWQIPPPQENQYSRYIEHLKGKRFVDSLEVIDFGGFEAVPAREFIGATLWHFYKAIESPHKSLLKLMLMESYASEFPTPHWVSLSLKEAVYDGKTHLDQIDPYIMMYQKVEDYLISRQELHRLELARQSFYFKINETLTTEQVHPKALQRHKLLKSLTDKWGWRTATLQHLDNRADWPLSDILAQQNLLIEELKQSYHQINEFARRYSSPEDVESRDIRLLGRKLQANLERKPGKLEIFTSSSAHYQKRLALQTLHGADDTEAWAFYDTLQAADSKVKPIKKARNLLGLLAWGVANHICNDKTTFSLANIPLSAPEISRTLTALEKYLAQQPLRHQPISVFEHPPTIQSCAMFINPSESLTLTQRNDGNHLTSNRFDPLSFGAHRDNLITQIDLILVSNWGEVVVRQFTGFTALFDALCFVINESPRNILDEDKLSFNCLISSHGHSITIRLSRFWQHFCQTYFHQLKKQMLPRYVFRSQSGYTVIQQNATQNCSYQQLEDDIELMRELNRTSDRFSPVIFDSMVFSDSAIPFIYQYNQAHKIQVFAFQQKQYIDLFILDELGSLYRQRHDASSIKQILTPYAILLNSVLQHTALDVKGPVEYFAVRRSDANNYDITPLKFKSLEYSDAILSIRITGEKTNNSEVAYTIFCNNREFSSLDHGNDLFKRVSVFILLSRRSRENYPIYITDIDVPANILGAASVARLQTVHFLNYKRKIEQRFNL